MATYCSIRDVRLALTPGAVEDDPATAASLPDWQIDDAIVEAEGVINAYLATRYAITPAEVEEPNPADPSEVWVTMAAPTPLRGWTRDIAAYLATLTFRRNKDLPEDDPVRLRFSMVMGYLTAIRDRGMNIPLPDNDTDDQGVAVENLYTGHLFSMADVGLGYEGVRIQRFEPLRPWEV